MVTSMSDFAKACDLFSINKSEEFQVDVLNNRDETIWRYINTVSIRRLTIRIVAQRDISRYDLDINFVIRRSHHVVFIFCI